MVSKPSWRSDKSREKWADSLMEAGTTIHVTTVYEKQLKAMNLARLLAEAEARVATGQTRPARAFLDEFKNARKR